MRFLAAYLMQGRVQAVVVTSVCALLSLLFPPISMVSSASVALVTLRRGATEGGYVLVYSAIVCALAGIFLVGSYQFPLIYGLVLWTPIWLLSVVLREYRHLFFAIELAVVIASLALIGCYFFQPDLANVWKTLLNGVLEPLLIQSNPNADLQVIRHSLSLFYRFVMTGLIAQVYVVVLVAGLFLGRWWQAELYNQGGFKKEYLSIKGQPNLAMATGVVLLSGLLSDGAVGQACWAISLLLFTLYALIGTVVLHCVFMTFKAARWVVPFLYMTMLIVPYAMIPVAILGLTETWLNLRNKIPNQTSI
jgi:hypothetical protein